MDKSKQLTTLFQKDELHFAPGAYDGLSAKLVEQAGFNIVYATGGGIARSMGLPDIGLLSFSQVVDRIAEMVDAVNIPLIADADNGYGNAVIATHVVKSFIRAGVCAIHIEDQVLPKRCGHYEGKKLVAPHTLVNKIKAIKDAHPQLFLIARTDAIATEGLNSAIDRSHQYIEAGADMLFVEAPTTVAQIKTIAEKLPYWLLLNMFDSGKTPVVPLQQLKQWGYKLLICPSDLQRSAIKAMQKTLVVLKKQGHSQSISSQLVTFKEREEIIDSDHYLKQLDQLDD